MTGAQVELAPTRREELDRFYRENADRLARSLRAKLANSSEVEEVTQEAYLRLCSADATGGVRNLYAFLYRTAMNMVVDRYRARRHPLVSLPEEHGEGGLELQDAEPSVEDAAALEQELTALRAAISGLPARCRQVFVMHRLKQMTQAEIAKELGISRQMVERHLARAIWRCREQLRPLRQEPGAKTDDRDDRER